MIATGPDRFRICSRVFGQIQTDAFFLQEYLEIRYSHHIVKISWKYTILTGFHGKDVNL